jgi:hypothetical protein
MKYTLTTCIFSATSTYCFDEWKFVGTQSLMPAQSSIDAGAEWGRGASVWASESDRDERPHAGGGYNGWVRTMPAAQCSCAGERPRRTGYGAWTSEHSGISHSGRIGKRSVQIFLNWRSREMSWAG